MEDADDLELDSESNTGSAQAQTVRKNISLKLKGKGRGRGRRSVRTRKSSTKKSTSRNVNTGLDDDEDDGEDQVEEVSNKKFDIEEDISKLETPTFTTLERGLAEPLHKNKTLRWDHRINLIGEKVINPMIHCCGKCSLPILLYGRMIPCKHVFCLDCAKNSQKVCYRCEEKVQRIENSKLGTVFMCTFGGTRHDTTGCRRTYLSQRDLQAHYNHRHIVKSTASTTVPEVSHSQISHATQPTGSITAAQTVHKTSHLTAARDPRDPRTHLVVDGVHGPSHTPPQSTPHSMPQSTHHHSRLPTEHREPLDSSRSISGRGSPGPSSHSSHMYPHPTTTIHTAYPSSIPITVSTRPNLITVPIQDDSTGSNQHGHLQSHPSQYTAGSTGQSHQIPPAQHQNPPNPYQPPHHYQQHPHPSPSYSPAPPVTYGSSISTQSFSQPPPPHMPPPQMHNPNQSMYNNPPPVRHPQQSNYSGPPLGSVSHGMPPQRFASSSSYEESSYSQPWGGGGVPPPSHNPHPSRSLPGLQNSPNMSLLQHGPGEPNFRPPYYP